MIDYQPDNELIVDGNAKSVDDKIGQMSGYIGSVVSVNGDVSHLVFDQELGDSDLKKLKNEFGVTFSKK